MPDVCTRWIRLTLLLGVIGVLGACATTPSNGPALHGPPTLAELRNLPDPTPVALPPSSTGNPAFYSALGRSYKVLETSKGYDRRGLASWYGPKFQGKKTSTGRPYDMYRLTAAHKTLPIPTFVRVTRLDNGHSIVVKVDDRGPFVGKRLIDLSYAAAVKLGMIGKGTVPVEVKALPPYQYLAGGASAGGEQVVQHSAAEPNSAPVTATADAAQVAAPSMQLAAADVADTAAHADVAVASGSSSTADAFLQVGAFSQRRRAEQLRQLLRSNLHRPVEIDRGSDALQRVRIGPLHGQSTIERVRRVLAELGIQKTYLVRN